jgi:hypothetical protein
MDKIGSKSGKIVKIGWNHVKTRFYTRFYASVPKQKMLRHCSLHLHVSSKYWPIDYYTVHTHMQNKTTGLSSSFFSFQSFTQVNNTDRQQPEKIKIPKTKSLNPIVSHCCLGKFSDILKKEYFCWFVPSFFFMQSSSNVWSNKAVREKQISTLIPFIPKLVSRVIGNWKNRLLQVWLIL